MLHSRQSPRRSQPSANVSSHVDPYGPDSADFAKRNEVFVSVVTGAPGLVRIDIGAPAPKQD